MCTEPGTTQKNGKKIVKGTLYILCYIILCLQSLQQSSVMCFIILISVNYLGNGNLKKLRVMPRLTKQMTIISCVKIPLSLATKAL